MGNSMLFNSIKLLNNKYMQTLSFFVVKLNIRPRKIIGPIDLPSLKEELRVGAFAWDDIAWCSEQGNEWRRLFEIPALQSFMSEIPELARLQKYRQMCLDSLQEANSETVPHSEHLHQEGTQTSAIVVPVFVTPAYIQVKGKEYGPLTKDALSKLLERSQFKDQVYIWYKGLSSWYPIQELPGFKHLHFEASAMTRIPGEVLGRVIFNREERSAIRRDIVSTVRLSSDGKQMDLPSGICVDISLTGVQIRLEKHHPFRLKDELVGELIPLSLSGVPAVLFRATVIWFKKEELKLGLFFTEIDEGTRDQLDHYLTQIGYGLASKALHK